MSDPFFEKPILNSPYTMPARHWELDPAGQPTQRIVEERRRASFVTPIPKPKKRVGAEGKQEEMVFDELLDPFNPEGSTHTVRFNTSKKLRWQTHSERCHVNWVILDSEWEAELCRVVEGHPKVLAYVKNQGLQFTVPYRCGSEMRQYVPDFIVLVDDGRGPTDPLQLVIEIKGYRREDAREKKLTMETYWVPGVNHLEAFGRWAFAEFRDVFDIEFGFEKKVKSTLEEIMTRATTITTPGSS